MVESVVDDVETAQKVVYWVYFWKVEKWKKSVAYYLNGHLGGGFDDLVTTAKYDKSVSQKL